MAGFKHPPREIMISLLIQILNLGLKKSFHNVYRKGHNFWKDGIDIFWDTVYHLISKILEMMETHQDL